MIRLNRYASIGWASFALGICVAAYGRQVDLHVLDEEARPAASERLCTPDHTLPCAASLGGIVSLINSEQWRRRLARARVHEVRIVFSAGIHRVAEPIRLQWGQGATEGISLELIGPDQPSEDRRAVLSGARALSSRNKTPVVVGSIPVHSRVSAFDLSDWPRIDASPSRGFGFPIKPVAVEVFGGDHLLSIASWPNTGYARLERPAPDSTKAFLIAGQKSVHWQAEPDLRAFAYWFHDWASATLSVYARDNGALEFAADVSPYGIKAGQRVRIENALSELDSPGEWYVDRARKLLYVWPLKGTSSALELSVASGLLRIENSLKVLVRNLEFEKTRGDAIYVRDSEDVVLESVRIRYTGNRALVVEGGARCGIRDSIVEHNGEGGITLTGGDRRTLAPSGHFAERTEIRNFSRLSTTYRPAIQMNGVGQRAIGNVISQAPHTAILFSGNDHLILGNEIFDVVRETSDAGAIYTGRDFTARGTVIEDNFLHDIGPFTSGSEVKGVYLDDQASGITVRGNVFARVQQPVFIGGGRDNLIENNVFYKSSPAIHLDARGLRWQRKATLDPMGELNLRLDAVPYRHSPYTQRYSNLATIRDDDFGAPKYNIARRNIAIRGVPYRVEPLARAGIELNGGVEEKSEDVFLLPAPKHGRTTRGHFVVR